MAGSSSVKLMLIIIGIGLMVAGGWYLYHLSQKDHWFSTPEEVAKQNEELKNQNQDLQDQNSDLERQQRGVNAEVLWGIFIIAILLALLYINMAGNGDGQNITMEEAIELTKEWAARDHSWYHYDDKRASRGSTTYTRIYHLPGQKVEGATGSWWYFISVVRYWPPGSGEPPGHGCLTYHMLSTDHTRAIGVYPGMNARQAFEEYKMSLQKSASPTDLAALAEKNASLAKIKSDLDTVRGGDE